MTITAPPALGVPPCSAQPTTLAARTQGETPLAESPLLASTAVAVLR